MILAIQTGSFAPGCKFNVPSTDVLLSFRPLAENPSHPLGGWSLAKKFLQEFSGVFDLRDETNLLAFKST